MALTKEQIADYLATWVRLNEVIIDISDEGNCQQLLDAELETPSPRGLFLHRIHSRFNKLRADRERAELMSHVAKPPISKDTGHQRKVQSARLKRIKKSILAEER